MTEKILNAFLGGCIPIYYGALDVFDIFNSEAFIYYDIENPEPALERVQFLEKNSTAYDHVMAQPILAHGNQTIQDYFSLSDDIGDGKLKNQIRSMINAVRNQYATE